MLAWAIPELLMAAFSTPAALGPRSLKALKMLVQRKGAAARIKANAVAAKGTSSMARLLMEGALSIDRDGRHKLGWAADGRGDCLLVGLCI